MPKSRIEVCDSEDTALVRQQWLNDRGYSTNAPIPQDRVIWNPVNVSGTTQIASDDDSEVWLIIATK